MKSLTKVVQQGVLENVKLMITNGADINEKDPNEDGKTALILATRHGHRNQDVAVFLLEKGADPHAADKYGQTALMQAGLQGHEIITRYLLEMNVDVNAVDSNGLTALMYTAKNGCKNISQLLLQKGADPNSADKYGITALMYASLGKHFDDAEVLLENGADPNAANKGHVDIAKLLLANGAESTDQIAEFLRGDTKPSVGVFATEKSNQEIMQSIKEVEEPLGYFFEREITLRDFLKEKDSKQLTNYLRDEKISSKLNLLKDDNSLMMNKFVLHKYEEANSHSIEKNGINLETMIHQCHTLNPSTSLCSQPPRDERVLNPFSSIVSETPR